MNAWSCRGTCACMLLVVHLLFCHGLSKAQLQLQWPLKPAFRPSWLGRCTPSNISSCRPRTWVRRSCPTTVRSCPSWTSSRTETVRFLTFNQTYCPVQNSFPEHVMHCIHHKYVIWSKETCSAMLRRAYTTIIIDVNRDRWLNNLQYRM